MTTAPQARAARKAFAPRWLVVTHRYVGVVMGLVMLMWFVSGIVMLFVRWPEVTAEQQAKGLAPISWAACCNFGWVTDEQIASQAVVEALDGHVVLRTADEVADLTTGKALAHLTDAQAMRVAAAFADGNGIPGKPLRADVVERDQWTVTGQFNGQRPFWKVRLSERGTDVYVSMHTGEVAQVTDARARLLNWFGPIPHWLYPAVLRQDAKLWSQVVIWTSLVGTFLTVTGLYLGIVAWRPWADRRMTPFRGWMAWHHLTGLFAGILTLTWVASGLVSMNPWGFLEGRPSDAAGRITGDVTLGDFRRAVLAAAANGVEARRVTLAPLGGVAFVMADGRRFDAAGRPLPLSAAVLEEAGRQTGPVAQQELIAVEDAYYRSGHDGAVPLPAWRVVQGDGTRLYLDPASGQLRARFDADRKAFRWLFEGLHRLDVIPSFKSGPAWLALVIALLLAAGTGVATGVWLGWRRIRSDVERLFRSTTPSSRP